MQFINWFYIALFFLMAAAIVLILYNRVIKKKNISNVYTPFDYITGQSKVEFHEEKDERGAYNDAGDDKDKNKRKA
ncbi:DUF3951 domain-containing protein [Fictibacillus sp. Mic-4]|uniref:DUF3951 domain-containing protein n=1 Tax=Fictibacillus TaxID=1329200 RepID=UPI000403608E|nr:DUF3951 domain-containing protein [Fictibacillus gelatini]